jgi:hypothetical protein
MGEFEVLSRESAYDPAKKEFTLPTGGKKHLRLFPTPPVTSDDIFVNVSDESIAKIQRSTSWSMLAPSALVPMGEIITPNQSFLVDYQIEVRKPGTVTVEARTFKSLPGSLIELKRQWQTGTLFASIKITFLEAAHAGPKGILPEVPPSAYVNRYKQIGVRTHDGQIKQVSMSRYLCNRAEDGGVGDSPKFWQAIVQAARDAKIWYGSDAANRAGQCFWGKGTPNDVANALRIVDEVASTNPEHAALKPFGAILKGEDRINKVCQEYIGLDCNGFVGNYAKENRLPQADPNLVPALWANLGPRGNDGKPKWRAKVGEICPLDVLIWHGGAHIAIIDSVMGGQFTICQSTGPGGPQTSTAHSIAEVKNSADGWFQVSKGMGTGGMLGPSTLPRTVQIKCVGFDGTHHFR